MHPLVELAKKTIIKYVTNETITPVPEILSEEMSSKAGVFVSLKKGGTLRGCIGTISPVQSNVAEEIIKNAISAATKDPRFPAVEKDELDDLEISVDLLMQAETITDTSELDIKKYGVIVKSGFKKGLLLPDLEGVRTVEQQVEIAIEKAGISADEDVEMLRFEVRRFY